MRHHVFTAYFALKCVIMLAVIPWVEPGEVDTCIKVAIGSVFACGLAAVVESMVRRNYDNDRRR